LDIAKFALHSRRIKVSKIDTGRLVLTHEARSIEILIDANAIPPWNQALHCKLQFYAPANATKAWLAKRGDEIIAARKAERA
jgi:hypothetical protein